jgi:hypothetical protein
MPGDQHQEIAGLVIIAAQLRLFRQSYSAPCIIGLIGSKGANAAAEKKRPTAAKNCFTATIDRCLYDSLAARG